MKKLLTILTLVAMLFSMATITTAADATGMLIYVAPNGNDANDGSEASPLATLKGARDKVRAIKAAGLPANGITVMFRGGEYAWTETVEFTSEDSGAENAKIKYCAYPGETVIFTGGTRVPASEFSPVTDENVLAKWSNRKAKEAIRQIDIKSYMAKLGKTKESDWYPLTDGVYGNNGDYTKMPVYSIDDNPALWLARYPNKTEGYYEENPLTAFLKIGEVISTTYKNNPDASAKNVFKYSDRKISKYAGRENVWFYGFPQAVFYHEIAPIESINATDSTITMKYPFDYGNTVRAGNSFFIFNVIEELDQEGEYFVDKDTGILYVYPNGEFNYFNIACFEGENMIKTEGASHITFSGLSFENTKGRAIDVHGGDSVRIEYCDFKNFGTNAVRIGNPADVTYTPFVDYKWTDWNDNYALTPEQTANKVIEKWLSPERSVDYRGKNHGMYACHIKNTGRAGAIYAGGNVYENKESGYYMENCDISFVAVNKRTYEPCVKLDNIHGVTIKNNTLSHFPGTGLSGYVTKGEIVGNEIYDGLCESYDMGLIYINYCVPALDLKLENNYLHDVQPEEPQDSPTAPVSQRSGFAIDFDSGCGVSIKNNVFENIPRVMFINDVETIENNVIIDCFEPAYTRNQTTHNYPSKTEKVFSFDNCDIFHSGYFSYQLCWPIFAEGENGEKYQKQWRELYPEFMDWIDITQSQKHEGKNFFNLNNNLVVNKRGYLLASHLKFDDIQIYSADGKYTNKNNTYTTDTSMFVDYENQNYQLTEAGAKKYGINIDMSKIGVQTGATGTALYKTTNTSLPTVSGGAVVPTTPSVSVPEKVKDAVVLKIGSSNAFATGKSVKVDSNNSAVMPQIINSRTLVPARFIAESFGGEVGWDDATRTVTIKLGGKTVTMVLDQNELMIDGEVAAVMDVPAQSIEGRTMVPLRALCETALSKTVFWDPMGLIVIFDGELMNAETDSAFISEIYNAL